jgi:integrase
VIAGLRHGEAAGLRWRHHDPDLEPLGRLLVATSYDTGRTKTDVTRRVPVHPDAREDPRRVEAVALGARLRPRARGR